MKSRALPKHRDIFICHRQIMTIISGMPNTLAAKPSSSVIIAVIIDPITPALGWPLDKFHPLKGQRRNQTGSLAKI